jgi:hypothetical protein
VSPVIIRGQAGNWHVEKDAGQSRVELARRLPRATSDSSGRRRQGKRGFGSRGRSGRRRVPRLRPGRSGRNTRATSAPVIAKPTPIPSALSVALGEGSRAYLESNDLRKGRVFELHRVAIQPAGDLAESLEQSLERSKRLRRR